MVFTQWILIKHKKGVAGRDHSFHCMTTTVRQLRLWLHLWLARCFSEERSWLVSCLAALQTGTHVITALERIHHSCRFLEPSRPWNWLQKLIAEVLMLDILNRPWWVYWFWQKGLDSLRGLHPRICYVLVSVIKYNRLWLGGGIPSRPGAKLLGNSCFSRWVSSGKEIPLW